jgi:hypothetical protein
MDNIQSVDLITDIYSGKLDAFLVSLSTVIKERKDLLAKSVRFKLRVGQEAWLTATIRPTYLVGAKIIIRKLNRERAIVDLAKPAGRFSKNINCSYGLITLDKP